MRQTSAKKLSQSKLLLRASTIPLMIAVAGCGGNIKFEKTAEELLAQMEKDGPVVPVAASMQISKIFKSTMFISVAFGLAAVILGLVTSYYLNLAPGGAIVVFSVMILLLVIGTKKYIIKSAA